MHTIAMNTASTETVSVRWREKVRPAEKIIGNKTIGLTLFAAKDTTYGKFKIKK